MALLNRNLRILAIAITCLLVLVGVAFILYGRRSAYIPVASRTAVGKRISSRRQLSRCRVTRTMAPSAFSDPRVRMIYAMAGKNPTVIDHLPCYCSCEQKLGHRSLLDCYVGRHASVCEVCLLEAAFAYKETALGETPTQIRVQINKGAWRTISLDELYANMHR